MSGYWISLLLVAAILLLPVVRRNLLTRLIFKVLKERMPTISSTEQEAIDAGTVWWERTLFRGKPEWKELLALPPAQLTQEEQAFMKGPVEELCEMLNDWEINEIGDIPKPVWRFIKEKKFFGLGVPAHYGGLEFSAVAHSAVIQKISSRSVAAAVTVMVPNSLGPAELLTHYGTDEQREYYLPRLATGLEVPCFALTGPNAGSDAGSMSDLGIVEYGMIGGEEVLGIRLTFNKRYITLAPVATLVGLAFHLYDPDHLLGGDSDVGITVALVPADQEGLKIGRRHNPLNTPFMNGPVSGWDLFIPMDWVIGGQERVGQGWRMLMESLAAGRSISLPALSTGAGKFTCRVISSYARVREQFGVPIGVFEGVSEKIARIAISAYTMDAVRRLNTQAVDLGERPSVLSAVAKYNLTEMMRQVVNDGMDVAGGKGIILGPSNLLGQPYIALPISITVEGANILTRSMIVFGQGAIRSHPYLLDEIEAIHDVNAVRALHRFDRALAAHVLSTTWGLLRSVWLMLSNGYLSPRPANSSLVGIYRQVNRLSAAFSVMADISLVVLGGKLKLMESISGRFADALSGLYQVSAVLKLHHDRGEPAEERDIVRAASESELLRVEQSLDGVLRNFPIRPVAWLLRTATMLPGIRNPGPGDRLLHRITRSVMQQGELRDQLTEGVYLPDRGDEPLAQLEAAMSAVEDVSPIRNNLKQRYGSSSVKPGEILQTIQQATRDGALSAVDRQRLEQWLDLHNRVIAVDDFSSEEMVHG